MNLSPAWVGIIRSLLVVVVFSVVQYLADASHLTGIVSNSTATLVAALALAVEHVIESDGNGALFGAVPPRH